MNLVGNILGDRSVTPHVQPIGAVAVCGETVAAGSQDGWVSQWRIGPQRALLLRKDFRHGKAVNVIAFGAGGRLLASGGSDGIAIIVDRRSGATLTVRHAVDVESLLFSPDGRFLFTGGTNGEGRIWDAATAAPVAVLPHGATVGAAANCGDLIVTGCNDRKARLWTWRGDRVAERVIADGPLKSIAAVADGLAIGSHDGTVTWVDRDLRKPAVLARFRSTPKAMDADAAGRLMVACYDSTIRIYSVERTAVEARARLLWSVHEPMVWGHALATNGSVLVTGNFDGAPVVYRMNDLAPHDPMPRRILVPRARSAGINAMALQPGRSRILVGGDHGSARAISLAGRRKPRMSGSPVLALDSAITDIKPLGTGAVVSNWGGEVVCIDEFDRERWRARWPEGRARAFCPVLKLDVGAERIVAGLYSGGAALIDPDTGQVVAMVTEAKGAVKAVATMGDHFALTGRYDPLRIGHVSNGEIIARIPLDCPVSDAVVFCPWRRTGEPARLAVTAGPNEVWIVELTEVAGDLRPEIIARSGGHDLPIKALLFVSRDMVLAGDYEGRIVAHTPGSPPRCLTRLETRLGVSAWAPILDDRVVWATFDGAVGIVSIGSSEEDPFTRLAKT